MNRLTVNRPMKAILVLGTTGALVLGAPGSAATRRAGTRTTGQPVIQTRICPVTGATVRCPGFGPRWTSRRGAAGRGYRAQGRPAYGRRSGGYGLRLRDGTGPNCPWR